jgi:hypothetical protein
MQPFLEVEVKETDQAYVVASLKLLDGKTNDARAILEKFPAETLSGFWQPRFQKLREQIGPGSAGVSPAGRELKP